MIPPLQTFRSLLSIDRCSSVVALRGILETQYWPNLRLLGTHHRGGFDMKANFLRARPARQWTRCVVVIACAVLLMSGNARLFAGQATQQDAQAAVGFLRISWMLWWRRLRSIQIPCSARLWWHRLIRWRSFNFSSGWRGIRGLKGQSAGGRRVETAVGSQHPGHGCASRCGEATSQRYSMDHRSGQRLSGATERCDGRHTKNARKGAGNGRPGIQPGTDGSDEGH